MSLSLLCVVKALCVYFEVGTGFLNVIYITLRNLIYVGLYNFRVHGVKREARFYFLPFIYEIYMLLKLCEILGLLVESMKTTVSLVVVPCSPVEFYGGFRGLCCRHHQCRLHNNGRSI